MRRDLPGDSTDAVRGTQSTPISWVDEKNVALLVDLYELTMVNAYRREKMDREAIFSLFVRRLPETRNFLIAAGLEEVLSYLEDLHFSEDDLTYLETLEEFDREFLDWLADFRFTGSVRAVPEGTPVFADEPLLEVHAPIAEAQIAETFVMNQVHVQTLAASKAARVVRAARGRSVVDFGLRRMHGADAGIKIARAAYLAGVAATSNVLAGRLYGLPVSGTMAHSYIQAHDSEDGAFAAFAAAYPGTILLVDTYDTLGGVRAVLRLADRTGSAFDVRGIRLDSGDLLELSRESRRILDDGGLDRVEIFASSGLDEYEIARLLDEGAPIDGFGVGTQMGVSADAPSLDFVYKLVAYGEEGRTKLSPGKKVLPGAKQVFREGDSDGNAVRDVIAPAGEERAGRPLLETVMREGRRLREAPSLEALRERCTREVAGLPERVRALEPADPPYPVELSEALRERLAAAEARAREAESGG